VATTDIPGAFMQADMLGEVHVKLEGLLAWILAKLDPQLYTKYLNKENRKVIMYVKYGTLQAAVLFWKDLTHTFTCWGFEVIPMIGVLQTKQLREYSALYYDM